MLKRNQFTNLEEIREYCIDEKNPIKLFSSCTTPLKLILVRPTSYVACERSFLNLRKLKTWLRSKMGQERLNAIIIANVHDDILDIINIDTIMDEFIEVNNYRKCHFYK